MASVPSFQDIVDNIKRGGLNAPMRVSLIFILICLVIGSYKAYRAIYPPPYFAKQDNFKIVFPDSVQPTINKVASTSDGSGGKESSRIYSVLNQALGTDYAVYVTTYTSLNASSLSVTATTITLQDDIEQLAQNDSSNLSNGKTISFKGVTAVEATMTPSDHSEATTNLLAFLKNNDLYIILGSGMDQSKFDSFSNSFNFTN